MTASGGFVVFSGCLLVFRQKNIRTKGSFKGQMYIQAGLMFICSLNVCTCGAESATLFVEKEQKGWMTLLMILGCHSWLGPGILCWICTVFSLTLYRH